MLDIKKLMFDTKKTQAELGEIINQPQSAISNMSKGFRQIRPEYVERWKEVLGEEVVNKCIFPPQDYTPHAYGKPVQGTILSREEIECPKLEDVEIPEVEEIELKMTPILTPDIVNQPGIDLKEVVEKGAVELAERTLPVKTKLTQDIVPIHDAKVYLENDEMAPDIEANDPVLIRFLDTTSVVPGRMYFIDLYRSGVVRWVYPQPDGSLLLRSTNMPDMVVQMDSVKSISEVVAIWKRPKSMPNERFSMFDEFRRRDDQMDELLGQNSRLIGIIEKKI